MSMVSANGQHCQPCEAAGMARNLGWRTLHTHIDNMDLLEARQGEILQDLAAKAPSTDHQDLDVPQLVEVLVARIVLVIVEWTFGFADVIQVLPPGGPVTFGASRELHLLSCASKREAAKVKEAQTVGRVWCSNVRIRGLSVDKSLSVPVGGG